MRRDPRTYIWDAAEAAGLIERFLTGKSFDDYQSDVLLRSAVERQFEIIGEALGRLSRTRPDLADAIIELPRVIAFRNILVHGYDAIDDALVWDVALDRLPALRSTLTALLDRS